ncbi:MAG: hypothetical protein H8E26_07260 [FCB group bacterium]|nr:hypothetical protein [FCB group bacterium]MBL7027871.1 hypothetical protein [Candidatus Neomarinimicrobiota bacterium]MBL7121880.1 hypothetical protein [Candidatus Neomarinimicrobiota bacterium]
MSWTKTLFRWLPALAILFGLITRFGAENTWLIQPSLMVIIFYTFIESRAQIWKNLSKFHLYVILGQVSIAIGIFFLLNLISVEVAAAGLVIALSPTAVSAGAVASGLRVNMSHIMSVIVVSNLFACFTFSIIPPLIGNDSYSFTSTMEPFRIVGITVVIPFIISKIWLRYGRFSGDWKPKQYVGIFVRILWAAILGVSASKVGVWYFENTRSGLIDLAWPLLLGMGIFAIFAAIGYYIPREKKIGSLISFSHKNSGLALLLIINTFPMSAVAVILSYSLAQNIFFSMLIGRYAPK